MEFFAVGSPQDVITTQQKRELLHNLVKTLEAQRGSPLRNVLLIPPDGTRLHSAAGELTCLLYEHLKDQADIAILPALGTHIPMSPEELDLMFPGIPHSLFHVHDWRNGIRNLGKVSSAYVSQLTAGKLDYEIDVQLANLYFARKWDAIFSLGQLVPHEVAGIANGAKNVLVGTGGKDFISKSHFIGAAYGMEKLMGNPDNPVRTLFNYGMTQYLADLPITFVLTVRSKDENNQLVTRGLFAGTDDKCFLTGSKLCREVNLTYLDRDLPKAVVFLDPQEFKTTWLGNKSVYRTRLAMADRGELIVLAPGVRQFGEDAKVDVLIRRHGYFGTPQTLAGVKKDPELANDLGAAAHLMHSSSEGRFTIRYCPGHLTRQEVESVGFAYGDLNEYSRRYNPETLKDGWNQLPDGEEVFYISNPALGLWGTRARFGAASQS